MAKLDFFFDNQKVNEDIANWRDLELEVTFDNDSGQGAIKSGAFEFVGNLADKINEWNANGMSGGPGIFEAPPFKIRVCGSNQTIFNGGINTADCTALYECDKVIAPLRESRMDFLNDRASSFSFAYLYSLTGTAPGRITQTDFVKIPYVINSIPDGVNVMTAGISLFMMLKEVQEIYDRTAAVIAELTGDTTMTVTAAASISAPTVAPGMAIGRVVVDVVRITFYILYLAFIVIAIIDLVLMLFANLIQPVKYKKGMRVIDIFKKSCDYLGFTFSSNLLNSPAHINDVILPRKVAYNSNISIGYQFLGAQFSRKDVDDNNNPSSVGYPDWTFADFILAEEQRLNAEVRIRGNTFYFEQKDHFINYANYTLPNIQRKNGDPHGTNACELHSNYLLSYSLDDQDTNTYDFYEGTSCQMQLFPNIIINQKNVLLKNLTEINLQYALTKRKDILNAVEKIFNEIYNVVATIYNAIVSFLNGIIGFINAIMSLVSLFTSSPPVTIPTINSMVYNPLLGRIGMMLLSNDFIGTPKVLVINSAGLLPNNNVTLTAAQTLMDNHHYTNFAIRTLTSTGAVKNEHNQWITYTNKEIPFCCGDYMAILNNNFIKTYDQKSAKVKSIVWNPYKETAKITYHVKEKYTNNLNQKYIIDGK